MEDTLVSRSYLEGLTTDELISMADKLGVDIPYGLDRIFIIEELLEIISENNEESDNPPEMDLVDSGLIESVPLPKQYNITFIEVIVRDPLWVFVFWEIKNQDKEQFERSQDFDGYFLRVSPQGTTREVVSGGGGPRIRQYQQKGESDGIFMVPVKSDDTSWYIGFTPDMSSGVMPDSRRFYKVELCVVIKGEETTLTVSNPFRLPELSELPSGIAKSDSYNNPLGLLSGYRDFRILRSGDRLFRNKRGV